MKCKLCKTEMIIDEWNGWVWTCFNCDYIQRKATCKEIERHERNMNEIYSQASKQDVSKIEN